MDANPISWKAALVEPKQGLHGPLEGRGALGGTVPAARLYLSNALRQCQHGILAKSQANFKYNLDYLHELESYSLRRPQP